MRPQLPGNEAQRLAALAECEILETPPERAFDDLTRLASEICDTPIALIPLIAETHQWFKSRIGLDAPSTPRDVSFCAHAILSDSPLVVEDATRDPRFKDNPLVVGPPHIRAYAGAPVTTREGLRLGTLCVIDARPRTFSERQIASLVALAAQASAQLELRRTLKEMERTELELHRALRDANDANDAKSRFLTMLSVELRTPLNEILGAIGLLRRTELTDKQRRCAELASTSSLSLLSLVNNALDLCRVESGAVHLEAIPFDPRRLLDDVAQQVAPEADRAAVHLRATLDARAGAPLVGDPTRLRHILVNLCSHAIQLSNAGELELRATVVDSSASSQELRFDILDKSGRVPDARLEPIARALSTPGESTANRVERVGLGLALASRLGELMGAPIRVRPADRRESLFAFGVNLSVRERPLPRAAHAARPARRRAVLAVNDPLTRAVALELLRSTGVDAIVATSRQEALRLSSDPNARLLVVDELPTPADALSLVRDARRVHAMAPQPDAQPLKSLFLTAHPSQDLAAEAAAAGVDDCAPFPLEPDEFLDRAHRLLDTPGAPGAPSAPGAPGARPAGGSPSPTPAAA